MQIKSIFPLLICVLAIITIQEFDSFLFNTFFYWVLSLLIYFSVFKYCRVQLKKNIIKFNGWDYLLLIYIIWVIICTIRGFVIADNYWEVKSNISDMLSLLLPSLIFILYNPDIDYSIIKYWTKWIFPIIVFFYIFDRDLNIFYTRLFYPCITQTMEINIFAFFITYVINKFGIKKFGYKVYILYFSKYCIS